MGENLSSPTKRNNIIKFDSEPFDEGSIRYCFKGKIVSGPDTGDFAVIKVFKHSPIRSQYVDARKELKVYSLANDYGRRFSELLSKNGQSLTVSFPEPDLVQVQSLSFFDWLGSSYFNSGDYICAEKYLKGSYKKFTNNTGYTTRNETMECFQHYTFVKSGSQAVVCDLQGVVTSDKFILTDPAVNSREQLFGNTDCGEKGMREILGRHKCNRICRSIGLEDNKLFNDKLAVVYNSTSKRRSHSSGI